MSRTATAAKMPLIAVRSTTVKRHRISGQCARHGEPERRFHQRMERCRRGNRKNSGCQRGPSVVCAVGRRPSVWAARLQLPVGMEIDWRAKHLHKPISKPLDWHDRSGRYFAIMRKDLATIALNGEVDLAVFSKAIEHFNSLMNALAAAVAKPAKINWQLESLEVSSAIATVRGISEKDNDDAVAEVLLAYETVGRDAQYGQQSRFGDRVNSAAQKLCSLINGKINSIRFETADADFDVVSPFGESHGLAGAVPTPMKAEGAVQGRVQSLSNRGGLRFTLYDAVDDHAVSCYLSEGMEPRMREAWGRLCLAYGSVRRSSSGRVSTVRDVSRIEILPEGLRSAWRVAIGCAPPKPGSISIEEAIRKGRDG